MTRQHGHVCIVAVTSLRDIACIVLSMISLLVATIATTFGRRRYWAQLSSRFHCFKPLDNNNLDFANKVRITCMAHAHGYGIGITN